MIEAAGGTFLGSSKFPMGAPDFSSFLSQAQASKAKNVAFIGGGADMINATKQSVGIRHRQGWAALPAVLHDDR